MLGLGISADCIGYDDWERLILPYVADMSKELNNIGISTVIHADGEMTEDKVKALAEELANACPGDFMDMFMRTFPLILK